MKTKHVIIAVVAIVAFIVAIWAFRYYTAEIRGKIQAKERVESGSHRLYSYEFFYDLYASIQSYETALKAQRERLETAETASERARIRSNIAGIKAQKRRAIERYNANAQKVETKAKFKADDLPTRIDY
jgi:hypothetical protein